MEETRSTHDRAAGEPASAPSSGNALQNGDPLRGLAEKFDLVKSEVDALQIAMMKGQRPWYKEISTIISVTALLFSFGTTYVSYERTRAQDIENQRVELRGILQRLASLPKEHFELTLEHRDNPGVAASLAGYVNQENALLVRQAAEIARSLPVDKISATEFFAVAGAMQNSYNLDGSREFLLLAIDRARDFNDEIAAVRAYANLLFLTGQPEAGRVEYQKALNVFSRYPGYNDYTQRSTHIWTELAWAFSEANAGFAPQVQQHVASAESYLAGLPSGPGTDQLRGQVDQARAQFAGGSAPAASTDFIPPLDPGSVRD